MGRKNECVSQLFDDPEMEDVDDEDFAHIKATKIKDTDEEEELEEEPEEEE